MERDATGAQRSSYLSCMMSPSCFPVEDEFQYSRIRANTRSRRWRNILRRFMRENKKNFSLCGSKPPISFQYDPVSYSQNFDEGCHLEEPRRLSQVFQDVRSHQLMLIGCGI